MKIIETQDRPDSGNERHREIFYRLARPTDAGAIDALGRRCSKKSVAQRFHSGIPGLPRGFIDSVVAHTDDRINLLAIDRSYERIIGVGSWCQTEPCSGELGLLVEDAYQGGGIGTQLLRGLVWAACARGSRTFEATVLSGQVGLALRLAGPAAGYVQLDHHGEVTALRAIIPPPPPPVPDPSEGRAEGSVGPAARTRPGAPSLPRPHVPS
jgi:GNAT superfamily N-acetyltransferase